jgi:hypothetical protein
MVLSPQWRFALGILADAGERGVTREALTAHFWDEMITSLVLAGLATSKREGAIFRLRITAADRRALDGDANDRH